MQVLKEEVNQTILEVAQTMFIINGYEATTLSAIAKKSGISKSNMYNYFESKEALFETLVSPAIRDIRSAHGFFQTTVFEVDNYDNLKKALTEKIPALYKDKDGILLLLDCSKGTKYENIFNEVAEGLEQKLMAHILNRDELLLISKIISKNLIQAIVQILRDSISEEDVQQNIMYLVDYHINGLRSIK